MKWRYFPIHRRIFGKLKVTIYEGSTCRLNIWSEICWDRLIRMLTPTSSIPRCTSTVLQCKHTHWWTHTHTGLCLCQPKEQLPTHCMEPVKRLPRLSTSICWLLIGQSVECWNPPNPLSPPAASFSLALHQEKSTRKKEPHEREKNKHGKRRTRLICAFYVHLQFYSSCFYQLFASWLLLWVTFFALGNTRLWRENSPAAAQWDTPLLSSFL